MARFMTALEIGDLGELGGEDSHKLLEWLPGLKPAQPREDGVCRWGVTDELREALTVE